MILPALTFTALLLDGSHIEIGDDSLDEGAAKRTNHIGCCVGLSVRLSEAASYLVRIDIDGTFSYGHYTADIIQ